MMYINIDKLEEISKQYGESFYILDTEQFSKNFKELSDAFNKIYPKSVIAYSYKTNYTPRLCELINTLGGFAEVVSDMEYEIAQRLGVDAEKIYFNGPYKKPSAVEQLLISGGTVNIDSLSDFEIVKDIATRHLDKTLSIGIRCNFDIKDNVLSRFGFDVENDEFKDVINQLKTISNLQLNGLHSHFATRTLETWPCRVEGILKIVKKYFIEPPKFISLGGGLYGKMHDSLKAQFNSKIPTYNDYAQAVTYEFANAFKDIDIDNKPMLIIEPGSALVGDAMKFAAKVISIKDIRNKKIATVLGSIYNINPTLNTKNPPVEIYHNPISSAPQSYYENLDFGGFTCIESDYLYRNFNGKLAIGDYAVFSNVGSYSVVLKPPFILPNFAMVEICEGKNVKLIKQRECFDDLFHTFTFDHDLI